MLDSQVTVTVLLLLVAVTFSAAEEYFDAMPSCKEDNWGMPRQKQRTLPINYYDEVIRKPCLAQWDKTKRVASEVLSMATAIHSANTQKYDDFESIDWIPENRDKYSRGSPWGKKFDFKSVPEKSIFASKCLLEQPEDKSSWELSRIGI